MLQLAVIIPALNEARLLPGLLSDLRAVRLPMEVVVVDGGSRDATVAVAEAGGARTLRAGPGRAQQMNAGAAASAGDWLCFLHADVRMPDPARVVLAAAVAEETLSAAVWRFAIDGSGPWLRLVEFGARLRDRVGGLPYGDQGLLVRRRLFEAVGGFPEIPIMEDVAMLRALRRRAPLARFPHPLAVSSRRWRREGPYFTWARNIALIAAYLAGVSPERLSRWYRPEPW